MTKTRNRRADSATAAVVAAQNAALGPLPPPAHVALPEAAMPFWDAVMRNRPRDRWNDADLAHAAVMARAQCDVERLQREIDVEGDVIDGKTNCKHALVEVLSRRAVAVARALHVHAEATQGRSRDATQATDLERNAAAEHDELIPTLYAVK